MAIHLLCLSTPLYRCFTLPWLLLLLVVVTNAYVRPLHARSVPTGRENVNVRTVDGPMSADTFIAASCWGQEPLLIRGAFNADEHMQERDGPWPTWDALMDLIGGSTKDDDYDDDYGEDGEDAFANSLEADDSVSIPVRTIRHTPGDMTSYTLELGFDPDALSSSSSPSDTTTNGSTTKWTMVLNDVEQYYPPLADWMDQTFGFLPRWRRDDGQISLAEMGGGIGPHVDNYDVFLIQTHGRREWQIRMVPVDAQQEELIENLDVRILNDWVPDLTIRLDPGDALYLPPRFPHCGTALSDQCMTLSVGCRAPTAKQLVSRVAEHISNSLSTASSALYQDPPLLLQHLKTAGKTNNREEQGSNRLADADYSLNDHHTAINHRLLNRSTRDRMKQMVLDAVNEIVDDDNVWDALLGTLLTESNRPRDGYPVPLREYDDNVLDELGPWGNAESVCEQVVAGKGVLYRAEGVPFVSSDATPDTCHRLYANGQMFECIGHGESMLVSEFLNTIVDAPFVSSESIQRIAHNKGCMGLLEQLVDEGLLYGSEEDEDEESTETTTTGTVEGKGNGKTDS